MFSIALMLVVQKLFGSFYSSTLNFHRFNFQYAQVFCHGKESSSNF